MIQVLNEFTQCENRVGLQLLGANVVSDCGARVGSKNAFGVDMTIENAGRRAVM